LPAQLSTPQITYSSFYCYRDDPVNYRNDNLYFKETYAIVIPIISTIPMVNAREVSFSSMITLFPGLGSAITKAWRNIILFNA